jgi:pimeloyl-ACP methyl ester carboxylesterase
MWLIRPLADPVADLFGRFSPEADRKLLARPELRAMLLDDLLNGSRTGLRAPIDDILLFGQDWGFSVRDVRVPIQWWHGDGDHLVPYAHGEHMVSLLPDAQLHVLAGESHLGGLAIAEDVLATLAGTWDAGTAHEAS